MNPTQADDVTTNRRSAGGATWLAELAWLLLCTAWALHLRTTGLNAISLWTDEFITLITVRRPLGQSLLQLQDYAAPLHQLLLRLLVHDDHPPSWLLRGPAVAFGVLGVPAAWWLARLAAGRVVAGCAALLVALNPELILHAREARQNTLFVLLAIVSTAALLVLRGSAELSAGQSAGKSAEKSEAARRRWNAAYIAAAALLAYAHYFGLLVLAAHAAFAADEWWRARREANRETAREARRDFASTVPGLLTFACVALLILPAIVLATRYIGAGAPATIGWIDNHGPGGQLALLAQLLGVPPERGFSPPSLVSVIVGAAALLPAAAALLPGFGPRSARPALRLCAWWLFAGFVSFAILRVAYRPILVERYALPAIIPALLLALALLRAARPPALGLALAGALTACLFATSFSQRERATAYRSDAVGLVAWVHEHVRAGDERWVIDWPTSPDDVPPEAVAMRYYGLDDDARGAAGGPIAPARLLRLNYPREVRVLQPESLASNRRVVIVSWVCGHEAVRECLRGLGRPFEEKEFGGLRVFVAEPAGGRVPSRNKSPDQ